MGHEGDSKEPPTAPPTSLPFDLKEFDFLRADIQALEAEIRVMERYALIAVGAIWTWFATEMPERFEVAAYLSIAMGVLGALRSIALLAHMGAKATYSSYVEEVASDSRLGGWERYFDAVTDDREPIPVAKLGQRRPAVLPPGLVTPTAILFWLTLIAAPYPFSRFLSRQVMSSPKSHASTSAVRHVASPSANSVDRMVAKTPSAHSVQR